MASRDSDRLFPELAPNPPPPPPTPRSAQPKPEPPCPPSGQLILGADKRNPLLSVYHDEDHAQFLIYYGFEMIEIVPDDPPSGVYKLMLGRLYNFGIKGRSLCETFSVDPKTLRRFGRALKSPPEEMIRILKGRGADRKITLEKGESSAPCSESEANNSSTHEFADKLEGSAPSAPPPLHTVQVPPRHPRAT